MAWPSAVVAQQPAVYTDYNSLLTAVQVWGGDVSAAGNSALDLLGVGLHTANASWQEFRWRAVAGASAASDVLGLQVNARASFGDADAWSNVLTVASLTGGVSVASAVTFNGALTIGAATTFNAIPTFAAASSGGVGSAQIKVSAGQASLDLWNNTTSGSPAPAGGSRWRLFADNVGGGGGSLTFGFYDVANSRVAGGFDNSGYLVASAGFTCSNAANMNFGGNWQAWPASIAASGSMTVSAVTVDSAQYIRLGPLVHFFFKANFNLGGTSSTTLYISLPVPAASLTDYMLVVARLTFPNVVGNEVASGEVGGGVISITRSGYAGMPLVAGVSLYLSGTYRVA